MTARTIGPGERFAKVLSNAKEKLQVGPRMIVRPATVADRAGVIALWETVFPDDPPHNAPPKVFDAKLALQDDMLFVAVDGDTVVGTTMVGYDGFRGWLHRVAVLPEYRRRSLATDLVRHAIRALQSAGCTKVNLQIRATNLEVRGFYEALGFDVEDRLSMARHIAPRQSNADATSDQKP